jgi:FkbM family methyltransferase
VLIEPIEDLANALRQHPELAAYHICDCIAADRDGEIEMNVFKDSPYISSVLPLDTSTPELAVLSKAGAKMVRRPARTLDAILSGTELRTIDLLKIDVQGFEDRVIMGAHDALARTACVFVEVSFRPLYHGSAIFSDIYEMLYERGLILAALEPGFATSTGELLQANALFVKR